MISRRLTTNFLEISVHDYTGTAFHLLFRDCGVTAMFYFWYQLFPLTKKRGRDLRSLVLAKKIGKIEIQGSENPVNCNFFLAFVDSLDSMDNHHTKKYPAVSTKKTFETTGIGFLFRLTAVNRLTG